MELACRHLLLLSLLLIVLVPPRPKASASGGATRLCKGRNLTDGETIASASGTFTLGFFSPGVSTRRYLGIWFTVSPDAVNWVANRDRPLNDKSGWLVFTDTGNLLLLDGSGRTAWSSNSTSSSQAELQLLDSGNLVVRDQGGSMFFWQSFDYPSDTMLAGMKMGKNLWTGSDWFLTAWRWPDDPSPGSYLRVLNSSGIPEVVLWQGGVKRYRTGPWNGQWFSGVPEMTTYNNLVTCQVTISPGELTYWFNPKPRSPLTRLVVTDTGVVKRLMWHASTRTWETFFQGPRDVCDSYGKCGAFGLCDASAAAAPTPFCSCLRGFSPASPQAWSLRDTSAGCRRNAKLDCGHGRRTTDGFVLVTGVKLPDTHNASVDTSITLEECRGRCLADCSCLAYTAANIRGGGGGSSGCVIWTDTIMDLRFVDRGQDLYLRLAKSELGEFRSLNVPIFTIVAPVASAVAIVLILLFMIWKGRKHKLSDLWKMQAVRCFDLATIKKATDNFSSERVIGRGAFASVYKAQLLGRTVAVKRFGLGSKGPLDAKGRRDFTREVELMARLCHGNLLRLLAYCDEGDERILIYAFMKNKSLDMYIFGGPSHRGALNWRLRLDIIRGIAQGVAYLHDGSSSESVVHRDLKPSNVLLDEKWRPRIADFNTAKLFVADYPEPESRETIVFTPGYASPDYICEGAVTLKCDVYSFGVTLLETLSGQMNGKAQGLLPRAWALWEQGTATGLLDEAVALPAPDSEIVSELERCVKIGLLCVQDSPDARPDMSRVVAMLTSKTSHIDQPNKHCRAAPPLHVADLLRPTTALTDLT